MAKVTFTDELCKGCGLCVGACPKQIVKLSKRTNGKGYPVAECVDDEACIACAFCARMCPDVVIRVEK